ncbi:unnamed protein product [Nezara viridula]|uniref:Nose resistant-to-fluoxetine protein N-terminal domain-containing protein n=1 Tax=Nezara viridula TaxID=85310 RepID=A0A9P0HI87_NEZVI|nr:unnamed protein product [Nezara viridula]
MRISEELYESVLAVSSRIESKPYSQFFDSQELENDQFQPREISLGVCLPDSCSATDLKTLIEATTSNLPNTVTIQRVRPVPGPYSILSDPKLHVLA